MYTKCYSEWLESGNQDFTTSGSPETAPLEEMVRWVIHAWDSLSPSIMQDSFKACGLAYSLDQSEDHQILVFKERKCSVGKLDNFSKMMQDRIADVPDQFNVPEEMAVEEESVRDDIIVDVIGHDHDYQN